MNRSLASGFHRWGMEHGAVDMESAPDLGELVLFRVQFTEFEEHLQGEDYRRLPARSC